LHILADRGLLDYADPVARHWPEFAAAGKQDITIRHLLCHEAGLFDIRHLIDDARRMLDWQHMTSALAQVAPQHAAGAYNAYHGLTYGWLVGEVIQRVAGMSLSELVRNEIAAPLGLDGMYIGTPAEEMERVARLLIPADRMRRLQSMRGAIRQLQRVLGMLRFPLHLANMAAALAPLGVEDFDWSAPEVLRASIPAANGVFTARSLARLYAALAAGGELDGVRLLSPTTVARATAVQNRRIDRVVPFPMHWRLGYHRAGTTRGIPPRAFGHYGFGGSGAWADPDRQLAVALVLNSGFGTPFGDMRTAQIGGAALYCTDRKASGGRR
jgi:CubicO group peptidase (beta-lactamase class C family)